jgi:hypothetical protein
VMKSKCAHAEYLSGAVPGPSHTGPQNPAATDIVVGQSPSHEQK